jgi:hypothetical protein
MDSKHLEYNVIVVKWGNKFTSEHVNRLYRMAKRNITLSFNFYCYTEDPTGICNEVNIIPLDESLNLEKWWWKLTLFKENNLGNSVNLYLDLDVVIQNNIDHFFEKSEKNKIVLISQDSDNWTEITPLNYDPKTAPAYNSSIMIWYNNELTNIFEKFIKNKNFYQKIYYGIDRFFTYEIDQKYFSDINYKEYYSRIVLTPNDDEKEFESFSINVPLKIGRKSQRVFFNPIRSVCIFNGCHENVFYQGMEKYLI